MNSHKCSSDCDWNWICLPATPRKQIKVILNRANHGGGRSGSSQINRDITWPHVRIAARRQAGAAETNPSAALRVICGADVWGDGGGDARPRKPSPPFAISQYVKCTIIYSIGTACDCVSHAEVAKVFTCSTKSKSNHRYVKENNNVEKVKVLIQLLVKYWFFDLNKSRKNIN